MASHMGVQTFATARNSQVEFIVQFALESFCHRLVTKKLISQTEIDSQKSYVSGISSDVWDHHVSAIQSNKKPLELWCQTTCYKGNGTGKPEPNKTYEVRETLVEGISIRQLFEANPSIDYRTIHFTVGDSDYTYQWFLDLKAASYDKSIYIGKKGYDIFSAIALAMAGTFTEEDKSAALEAEILAESQLGKLISGAIDTLEKWWISENHPKAALADQQWGLVKSELASADSFGNLPSVRGMDIKGRTNALIFSEDAEDADKLIPLTAAKLLEKNPFLGVAIRVVSNWSEFETQIAGYELHAKGMYEFLNLLWNSSDPIRLITRRLLLRLHTDGSVAYVQDRNIDGVTEHNLYAGDHSAAQVASICKQIQSDLSRSGIHSTNDLVVAISSRGKRLINQARWFEAKNGTELKPSFDYVELALRQAGFGVTTPSKAKLKAVGYHAELSKENVKAYTNLKVVLDGGGRVLAVIKAKFFRSQEFPRRCKEEAFVGLSLKYIHSNGSFGKRITVPLIMFVDMASDCKPPLYAVKRLASFGWKVVFSTDELIACLNSRGELAT